MMIDVATTFKYLKNRALAAMQSIFESFEDNYVLGRPGRGRRRALPSQYDSESWNHYNSSIRNFAKTNNISEGCHSRFRLILEKNQPDVYSLVKCFQKEQRGTKISVVDFL